MRAYIHGFQGRPWNHECRVARDGFRILGVETVLFTTNEQFDTRKPEDVVVGGTIIVWHGLNQRGITTGHNDYPPELFEFRGRKIKRLKLKEINDGFALGCYGADPIQYAKLLSARWCELAGIHDECDIYLEAVDWKKQKQLIRQRKG